MCHNRRVWSTPGKHLPHCPHCGAFVSPRSGVCNSSRCSKSGQQVVETIEWPPADVQFTSDRSKWGRPVHSRQSQQAQQPQETQQAEAESKAVAAPSPSPVGLDWERILALEDRLRATAWHIAKQTGGDADELFSTGRMAIIEKAQEDPYFLGQKKAYINTLAAWRMRDALRPGWVQANSIPLEDTFDSAAAASSFEHRTLQSLTFKAIADTLDDGAWEILETIQTREDVRFSDGRVNVSALSDVLGIPKSTMYRQVDALRETLGVALMA